MTTNFPERYQQLQTQLGHLAKELPGVMSGFGRLHMESTRAGIVPAKYKELIALAVAICVDCEDCIAFHTHDAMSKGAVHEEIVETIGVAIMMGGGPASMYACAAYEALEQFEAQSKG
ncbi:MAG: carboxymuconolactone decarboxylase family protein [Rhodanobacter sp.]